MTRKIGNEFVCNGHLLKVTKRTDTFGDCEKCFFFHTRDCSDYDNVKGECEKSSRHSKYDVYFQDLGKVER